MCIVIDKAAHRLETRGTVELEYPVSLGIDPVSPKRRRSDGATPEGLYYITYLKDKSRFHKFLGISYPNAVDAWHGLRSGLISPDEERRILKAVHDTSIPPQDTALGGGIGIHGGGVIQNKNGKEVRDWTEGCIALDDRAVDTLFELCRPGTLVIIYNSKANFFDMIRPFAYPVDPCDAARGEYYAGAGFQTSLGTVLLTIKEWDGYARSIRLSVFGHGVDHPPTCEILDRNGDGKMGYKDHVEGRIPGIPGDRAYSAVQEAVVRALSQGRIKTDITGWSP